MQPAPSFHTKETRVNLASFRLYVPLVVTAFAIAGCQQQKPTEEPAPQESAAPDAKPGIVVAGGVLVLPVMKDRPGVAYFSVTNGGPHATKLLAAAIDGAGRTEMHETMGGSMSPMNEVAVSAGETVKFEPGGKHLMVFDLAGSVAAGGTAELTLTFDGGDKVSVPLKVEARGAHH